MVRPTSSSGGQVYSKGCSLSGSKYQAGHLPTAGAGVPPDCGVLWQAPTTAGTVTATMGTVAGTATLRINIGAADDRVSRVAYWRFSIGGRIRGHRK